MSDLGPADILGYISSLLFVIAVVIEAVRRARAAQTGSSPVAFLGHMLAAVGFGLRSLLTQEMLIIVIAAEMFVVSLIGFILALPDRLPTLKMPAWARHPSRHVRGLSALVGAAKTPQRVA